MLCERADYSDLQNQANGRPRQGRMSWVKVRSDICDFLELVNPSDNFPNYVANDNNLAIPSLELPSISQAVLLLLLKKFDDF
jgi:hypothetical protein